MDSWFAYVYIKCEWMKVCVRVSVYIHYMEWLWLYALALCVPIYGVAHHFVNVGIRRIHAKCWKMNSLARSFSSFALAPCDGHGCKCTHTHINLKSYSRRETTWFDHINFPQKKISYSVCARRRAKALFCIFLSVFCSFFFFCFFFSTLFCTVCCCFLFLFSSFGRNG